MLLHKRDYFLFLHAYKVVAVEFCSTSVLAPLLALSLWDSSAKVKQIILTFALFLPDFLTFCVFVRKLWKPCSLRASHALKQDPAALTFQTLLKRPKKTVSDKDTATDSHTIEDLTINQSYSSQLL